MQLPETAACIQLLAKWAADHDRDEMMIHLARRLRQLHHPRLSEWLSRTSFKNSVHELQKSFATVKGCPPKNDMAKGCLPENVTAKGSPQKKAPKSTPPGKERKEQIATTVETSTEMVDDEFVSNETILDRLKKLVPDKKVGLEILLVLIILIALVLLLLSIRLLVNWCLKLCCKWKNLRKGYRNVEAPPEEFEAGVCEEFDLDEEIRKYCNFWG